MTTTTPRDDEPHAVFPHRATYVFSNFEEAISVDCYCDEGADHFGVYPFYDEVIKPIIDDLTRRVRRRFGKETP